jgi:hypothetical protein
MRLLVLLSLLWRARCWREEELLLALSESPGVVAHSAASLPHSLARPHVCSVLCVGATWDGHFRAWVLRGVWRELAAALHTHTHAHAHAHHASGEEEQVEVEVGYFLYSREALALPAQLREVWSESPPSYDVKVFRSGAVLRNHSLEQELRSGWPALRRDVWRDVVALCDGAGRGNLRP